MNSPFLTEADILLQGFVDLLAGDPEALEMGSRKWELLTRAKHWLDESPYRVSRQYPNTTFGRLNPR